MGLQGMQAEEARHPGAPRDICHYAPGGAGSERAAAAWPSARGALHAVARRLHSPFKRGGGRGASGGGGGGEPDQRRPERRPRSRWWFLLPIFLHAVGGIMAFFMLRDDDDRTARNCLYLGLTLTALALGPLAILAVVAGPGAVD